MADVASTSADAASPASMHAASRPDPSAHEPKHSGPAPAGAPEPCRTEHVVRVVTATSLFDGHDAAINVMRRILQDSGAEVIHLAHNRSVREVVQAAVQEDAQAICLSSYQGGHLEYFRFMRELTAKAGAPHIKLFGGGGGVIVPREIHALHDAGIDRVFSPEDGRRLGLQGMINVILTESDFSTLAVAGRADAAALDATPRAWPALARALTAAELEAAALPPGSVTATTPRARAKEEAPVIGVTGTGGSGKSSLTDELIRRFLADFPERTVAIVSIDPSRKRTGGALLGDRIRMNAISNDRVYMRSFATRDALTEIPPVTAPAIALLRQAGYDLIFVETPGIGQGDTAITALADLSLYVTTAEYGAPSQLEKIDMLDFADLVALNKFERRGAADALPQLQKQVQRNRKRFSEPLAAMPVYPTIASHFADAGCDRLYAALIGRLADTAGVAWARESQVAEPAAVVDAAAAALIPGDRERYLAEIAATLRRYHAATDRQARAARRAAHLAHAVDALVDEPALAEPLKARAEAAAARLPAEDREALAEWEALAARYTGDEFVYTVRDREVVQPLTRESLSHTAIPRVRVPTLSDAGDRLRWLREENVPGAFPFTAGVFPLKRTGEDPTRMFAGEGPPERTNKRFHLLADGQPAVRLSTAFDSVTLYGEDPHERPDIYGKIGESGVSVCTVEDAERLYAGFDLCAPTTSVSMTINGPAPIVLGFFLNVAVRQQLRRFLKDTERVAFSDAECLQPNSRGLGFTALRAKVSDAEYRACERRALHAVRGTVQADILKEDQAQNTCIFSTEFALRLMGDVQEYFIEQQVRNFYSVSISGYHIAEAGANPITQLAFTLANGFTYVEYYRARGMAIDEFAPNLSFFFSNGLDPEYTVIGRVARRLWAIAMRDRYGAKPRSQKLKYHIQTSGRSLHAQEMGFNDIRTTLQALLAIADNCNSLHTNAYDEAVTTPTEESVRRAMAIQLIINREFGLAKNENPLQGSYFVEWLTDVVEASVLELFERLADRGGVLGAMETGFQRARIQEESLTYERQKHTGELPLVGVNTFLDPAKLADGYEEPEPELRRASYEEKDRQIARLRAFQAEHAQATPGALARLKETALAGGNVFAELMQTVQVASLGQITHALYEVGGQYRRNM